MLTLDIGGSQRPIPPSALIEGVTGGRIPLEARVRIDEGPWLPVSRWYLDNSRIQNTTDTSEERFVRRHASTFIDEPDLLRMLGLDKEAEKIDSAVRSATTGTIDIPTWGRGDNIDHMLPEGIDLPEWNPDPTGAVSGEIRTNSRELHIPAWGAPYEMPVAQALKVPPWRDPAKWAVDPPPEQAVKWRRKEVPAGAGASDSIVELLGQPRRAVRTNKPPPPIEPPARRRKRIRNERKAKTGEPPPQQPPVLRKRRRNRQRRNDPIQRTPAADSADEQTEPDQGAATMAGRAAAGPAAAVQGVTSESTWGCAGCLFKFAGLAGIAFAAFMAVDAGLEEFADQLPAIAPQVKKTAPPPRKRLNPLIARGPSKTVLHAVIAVDLSVGRDVATTRAILEALDKTNAYAVPPRVVLLPRVGVTKRSKDLAAAIIAAHRVGGLWTALKTLRGRTPWSVQALSKALRDSGADIPRFEKLRHMPSVALQARVFSTMAGALRLGKRVPLMVNGWTLPTPPASKSASVQRFVAGHASAAKGVLDAVGGDPTRAWAALQKGIPASVRSRFSGWIVAGERIPSQPVPAPVSSRKDDAKRHLDVPPHAPRLGPKDAPVQIVVFSDFHCRHCKRYARNIRRVAAQHSKSVQVRFVHYPIVKLHPRSWQASRAAWAAQQQGRFWEAHDWLFRRGEKRFSVPALVEHLAKRPAGANKPFDRRRFMRDMVKATDALKLDRLFAKLQGIRGTPVTFVNAKRLRGVRTVRQLNAAVTAAMLRTRTQPTKGKP